MIVQARVPELPAELARPCDDPGVRAGRDARGELARNRRYAACATAKHRDVVEAYRGAERLNAPGATR